MKTVNGIYTSVIIFTDNIEEYALAQIQQLCDNPSFENSRIRIMPDVHPGKVGTIGFTATVEKRVLPNMEGRGDDSFHPQLCARKPEKLYFPVVVCYNACKCFLDETQKRRH